MDETDQQDQSPDEVFLSAALFESALAVLALLLGWALGPSARDLIPELEPENLWPIFRGIGLGLLAAVPIFAAVEVIRRIPWEPIQELERLTEDGMIKSLLMLNPPELLVISLCAGIGEELLFRGWLMYWLANGMSTLAPETNPTLALFLALMVSSLVFGFFHPITRLYIVLAAVMGVYFGLLVIWTGNLLVPIVAHAAYDAAQLLIARRELQRDPGLP